jgi:hypothetical protein
VFAGINRADLTNRVFTPRSILYGGSTLALDSEGYWYTPAGRGLRIYNPQYFPKPVDCVLTLRSRTTDSVNCLDIVVDQPAGRQKIPYSYRVGTPPIDATCTGGGVITCTDIPNCAVKVTCKSPTTSQCEGCKPGFYLDESEPADRCLGTVLLLIGWTKLRSVCENTQLCRTRDMQQITGQSMHDLRQRLFLGRN